MQSTTEKNQQTSSVLFECQKMIQLEQKVFLLHVPCALSFITHLRSVKIKSRLFLLRPEHDLNNNLHLKFPTQHEPLRTQRLRLSAFKAQQLQENSLALFREHRCDVWLLCLTFRYFRIRSESWKQARHTYASHQKCANAFASIPNDESRKTTVNDTKQTVEPTTSMSLQSDAATHSKWFFVFVKIIFWFVEGVLRLSSVGIDGGIN